jgi:hypothetical protein
MKSKKKTKRKKKDIPSENSEEIIPLIHQKVGNVNNYSEEVAKGIIELLISLTISKNFTRITETKINDFCNNELIKNINNLIRLYNINCDIDDFNNSEYIISKIKYLKTDTNEKRYKTKIHKKAKAHRNFSANKVLLNIANIDKTYISEMRIKNKELEDFLNKSSYMKNNIDLLRDNSFQYDIEINKYNYWGNITEPKSYFIDRTSSLYNNIKKDKNIFHKISTKKSTERDNLPYKKKNSIYFKRKSMALNEDIEIHKKKFIPILQMPFVELSKEENKNKESEEIQKIRKETLEFIKAKKEKQKLLEESMKNKVQKDIIKGKYTTDVEGKIVYIKEIHPENLLKEFYPCNTRQKDLLLGKTIQELKKENELLEKKAKKKIIFNNTGIRNTISAFNFIQSQSVNKETDKENKTSTNNPKLKQSKVEISTPPPFETFHRYSLMEKIPISGSNFKIMKPSPGVKIKEHNNVKAGDINYFETFHKFSLEEFNKVLKNTLSLEKEKLRGNFLSKNIFLSNKDLIQKKEESNKFKALKISTQNYNNKNKKNFRKTFSESFRPKKYIQKPMKEFFSLNDKNHNELKEILLHDDELNINLVKSRKFDKISSTSNIFNRRNILTPEGRISKKKKEFKYHLIDDFNKDLIMGLFPYGRDNNELPKLPPRNISFNKLANNLNLNGMNRTTSNFYRTRRKRNNDLVQSLSSNTMRNKKVEI